MAKRWVIFYPKQIYLVRRNKIKVIKNTFYYIQVWTPKTLIQVRTGEVKTGEVKTDQVRTGQVVTGSVRVGQLRTCEVKLWQVKSQDRLSPVKTAKFNLDQVKFSQDRSNHVRIGQVKLWQSSWERLRQAGQVGNLFEQKIFGLKIFLNPKFFLNKHFSFT